MCSPKIMDIFVLILHAYISTCLFRISLKIHFHKLLTNNHWHYSLSSKLKKYAYIPVQFVDNWIPHLTLFTVILSDSFLPNICFWGPDSQLSIALYKSLYLLSRATQPDVTGFYLYCHIYKHWNLHHYIFPRLPDYWSLSFRKSVDNLKF